MADRFVPIRNHRLARCRPKATGLASVPLLPALLGIGLALPGAPAAAANETHGKTGSVILRMCQSGDSVKMLAVMCQGYLDGFLDAAQRAGTGRTAHCVHDADRKRVPAAVVEWIGAHPESLNQPAAEVVHRALIAHFPCKGRT